MIMKFFTKHYPNCFIIKFKKSLNKLVKGFLKQLNQGWKQAKPGGLLLVNILFLHARIW